MDLNKICSLLNLDIRNINEYTKDDIKQNFKKIALECHPDKLSNTLNDKEKEEKIERFKDASIAYNKLLKDFENYGKISHNSDYDFENFSNDFDIYKDISSDFWYDVLDEFMKKENKAKIFADTFENVASFFMKSGLKTKFHYKPSMQIKKHNITLPVSYGDLYNKKKRKVRLILKNIADPVFLNIVYANEFPIVVKQFLDEDGIEHEIVLKMTINETKQKNIKHILNDKKVDLISDIEINYLEYLTGVERYMDYIDDEKISIWIPAFTGDIIIMNGYGLCGGNLIIYVKIKNISKSEWKTLKDSDKNSLISILSKMYITL